MLHRDGHKVLVHVKNVPIYVDGQLIGVYGIIRDITESKRAEEELRQTRDQLESFIKHTADAIYVCDLEGNIRKVNQAFENMYGWRAEEVIGKRLPMIPDDKWSEVQQLRADLQKYGHAYAIDTVRQRRDGTLLSVSLTISPIRNEYGKLVGMAGAARDITESKRVEAALRESESKYRLIAENTSDLIVVLGVDGVVEYASPSHETMLGYGLSHYQGCNVSDLVHPDDVPNVVASFAEMIRTKRPREVVCRYAKIDESWVFLEARGMPVFDDQGDVQSVVVVARDITERRKTEAILRKSDKLSVVGQLAAGVAHEIRNPLTAIKGFVQLLHERNHDAGNYYEIILSELDRIEFIIGEFLVLAKPQSVKFQQRDIRALLQSIIALLETQAILNNVQILTDIAEHIPDIECEESQLKQVFVNVLKNSIESMPNGGKVFIHVDMDDDMVLISIADQGCGIPPERLYMLGEPFYTTKEKGTGLGLMVSYRIIEDHQGSLSFKSEVDQGTLVEVRLPIRKYVTVL
jgi:two-component system sporulation sensor kinase A